MRSLLVAALLLFVALPLASASAKHPHRSSGSCGCGTPIPTPITPACGSCEPACAATGCSSCNAGNACGGVCDSGCGNGCGSCGRGLCSNPAAFYQALYAEFYARNPWYLEHKKREGAARLARMYGQNPDAAKSAPYATGPNRAAAASSVVEPIQAPEPKAAE